VSLLKTTPKWLKLRAAVSYPLDQAHTVQPSLLWQPPERHINGGGGRPRSITHPTLDALREHLLERPDQYLDKMAVFLWDKFKVLPALSAISRRKYSPIRPVKL
jgi:hypothetical protein